jgi:hypothetical protein
MSREALSETKGQRGSGTLAGGTTERACCFLVHPTQECAGLLPRVLLGSTEERLSCREASRNEPRITRMGTDRIWDLNLSSVTIRVIRGLPFYDDRSVVCFSTSD